MAGKGEVPYGVSVEVSAYPAEGGAIRKKLIGERGHGKELFLNKNSCRRKS